MGLDAYVYRNRTRLPFDPFTPGVSIDGRTGVIDFDDPDLYHRFGDVVVAIHRRLGNVAKINQLDEELQRITPTAVPIIRNTVLGSGAHCGDLIEVVQLEALEQELNLLAAVPAASRHIHDFLGQMRELVAASRSEGNPIYFG